MIRYKTGVLILFHQPTERILYAAAQAYGEVMGSGYDVWVTSARDSQHGAGSLHPLDRALDLRTRHAPAPDQGPAEMTREQAAQIRDRMAQILGPDFDVVLEHQAPGHLHAEFDPKPTPTPVKKSGAGGGQGVKAALLAGLLLLGGCLLPAPVAAEAVVDWTVEQNSLVELQLDTDGDGLADRTERHVVARSGRTVMTDAELDRQAAQDRCWLFIVEEDDGRFVYFVNPDSLVVDEDKEAL